MKLSQGQLRKLIESVVAEGHDVDDLFLRLREYVSAELQNVHAAYKRGDKVAEMQHYTRASKHMKSILEVLEGHPENVR